MTFDEIRKRTHELNRRMRDGDDAGAELLALELAPVLEPIFEDLDDRGLILSWGIDS